jgi:hypothetical protein
VNVMPENRIAIYSEIEVERLQQDAKWGVQDHPIRHAGHEKQYRNDSLKATALCNFQFRIEDGTWFEILHEEFREIFAEDTPEGQRAELVQMVAVGVAMIECIDRQPALRGRPEKKE